MDIEQERTVEQATSFDEIREIRKGFRTAARQNKIDFTSALAEANKKPTHFVLELLQNAEDANASEVDICLFQDRFVFSHNGSKKFRLRDMRGITGLGDSGKGEDDNSIGHFGMGFKSVFGICTTPEIYTECDFEPSRFIAFKIEDLFVPQRIEKDERYKKGTHFVLRFEHPEMTAEQTHNLLLKELTTLDSDCILFLRKINKVTWSIDGTSKSGEFCKGKSDERLNDIAAYRTIYSCGSVESQYLFFERSFEFDDKTFYTSIAYRVEKDKADKRFLALEKADTKLFVFFQCEGESTYLKFKINAPFMTTSNRDAIIEKEKYRSYNNRVLEEIIGLYADSLPCIKEHGYFNTAFLGLLPIYSQLQLQSGKFARPFYLKTIETLKTGEYLPTEGGSHAKASQALLVGSKDLVQLLDESDAAQIFSGRGKWLDSTITSNGATASLHAVIRGLEVPDIDASYFIRTVPDKFIASKPDEWLIKFYKAMTNIAMVRNYLNKKFIRLENDQMVAPFMGDIPNAFLPREGMKSTTKSIKAVFCKDENARAFFEYIKIGAADIVDDIRDFVGELSKCKDEADYLLVMELIADAYNDKDTTDDKRRRIAAILQDEFCILCDDESREKQERHKPSDAFYRHNSIETIYKGIPNWYICDALVAKGNSDGAFARFLTASGVNSSILIVEQKNILTWHEKEALRGQAPYTYQWDTGWQIDKIEAILATMTKEKSIALWKAIDKFDSRFFTGTFKWSYGRAADGVKSIKSYFLQKLQKAQWIYTIDGLCVTPSEILYDDTLEIYPPSKVIESNFDFMPRIELPLEIQTKLDIIAGIPPEYLRRIADDYRRAQEEDGEFNPVDIHDVDIPIGQEAFVNTRSGLDEADLEDEEEQARVKNKEADGVEGALNEITDDLYGGSENEDDDDAGENDLPPIDQIDSKVVARMDSSEKQKKIADWSENYVLQRVLRNEFETSGYTITDEGEFCYTAERGGKVLKITRHNEGKKNQRAFDISIKRGGENLQWIEVKASENDYSTFRMSGSQWSFARTLAKRGEGNKYFVYFVPRAGARNAGLMILQNPYEKWTSDTIEADPIEIRLVSAKK